MRMLAVRLKNALCRHGMIFFIFIFIFFSLWRKSETNMMSRDMYYEKWGFMLIFWNLAGVPFSYCHCVIYLYNHHPDTYRWNRFFLAGMYVAYLFVYWVWDTTNSQKNRFRQQERGTVVSRRTFPQLPWQTLNNPKTITAPDGTKILIDGWCKLLPLSFCSICFD